MKCFECDGQYEKIVIRYDMYTQYGELSVPDVEVESCNKCGDDIIGYESLEKIDEAWNKLVDACAKQIQL
jgi:hypothetical protein